MNPVPIAFAFDRNLTIAAAVAINSLLASADDSTYYKIFILHPKDENVESGILKKVTQSHSNAEISFIPISSNFDNSYVIRGITTPAYFRLLIPELLPQFDKIIYADVDFIFRMDLSALYETDLTDKYIAATIDIGLNNEREGIEYIRTLPGTEVGKYIQSGFLVMNCKKLREDHIVDRFKRLSNSKLRFQDQDILNITCMGHIQILPIFYNMTDYSFLYAYEKKKQLLKYASDNDILKGISSGNIHYNGHKPWKKLCLNFDIWWQHYRNTPIFDGKYYFSFFKEKRDELEKLPLSKRIKLLIRYFIR